ncbi:MAG: HTTM domain-containing protein [Chitinophagales bacterium]
MNMHLTKWTAAYRQWIFEAYPAKLEQLGLFRLFFISYTIFIVGLPKYSDKMADFPSGFFNPPPFFSLFFSQLAPSWYFQLSDILIFICAFFLLIGFKTRLAGILFSLIIIINNGFVFSTGKIDHSFLVWFCPLILSFSSWGASFSIDSLLTKENTTKPQNWTISFLSMCLGFGFFTSGLIKFVSSWLSLNDSMLRAFFLRNYYVQQKQAYFASFFENYNATWFWESGDWFTIVFEMGFLLVIFWPRAFRFFTLLALFFHGAVLLMFNIGFYNYLVFYLLFWMPLFPMNKVLKLKLYFDEFFKTRINMVFGSLFSFVLILVFYLAKLDFIWLKDAFLIFAMMISLILIFLAFTKLIKKKIMK